MKNKLMKLIAFAVVVLALVCAMIACGSTNDSTNKGNGGSTNDTNLNVNKKPAFSEVQDNYNKKDVKKAESNSELNLSFFTKKLNSEEEVIKNTLSVALSATRITDGTNSYVLVKLKKGTQNTDGITGVLDYVAKELENPGPVLSLTLMGKPELREPLAETSIIVKYISSFIKGNIDVGAEAGKATDAINVKGKYKVTEKEMEGEGELWLEISDEFLGKLTNRDVGDIIFADYVYPALAFDISKGNDTESDRVDKVGVSSYRVELPSKPMCDSLDGVAGLIADIITDRSNQEEAVVKSAVNKVLGWVNKEETSTVFEAKANKDKLPTSAKSTATLSMNIDAKELKGIIDDCKDNQIIEESDGEIAKLIVGLLDGYLCGTKGEPKIGLEATFIANENYDYSSEKCSLAKTDEDLYLERDAEAEGRIDIETFLKKLTIEQVESFCEEVLKELTEETAGEIIDVIKGNLSDSESGVTMDELCNIVIEVLDKWETEDSSEKEIIAEIRKKLLNRYASKDNN